jgi:hypothetical protein
MQLRPRCLPDDLEQKVIAGEIANFLRLVPLNLPKARNLMPAVPMNVLEMPCARPRLGCGNLRIF